MEEIDEGGNECQVPVEQSLLEIVRRVRYSTGVLYDGRGRERHDGMGISRRVPRLLAGQHELNMIGRAVCRKMGRGILLLSYRPNIHPSMQPSHAVHRLPVPPSPSSTGTST